MSVRTSQRLLAVLCGLAALLPCATDTFAQRYAPDGSVIPDAVRADPVLSPDAVRPDPVRPAD